MDGSGVRVDALLCDSAQVVDGKLYLLGGGWGATMAVAAPSAIALVVTLPATAAGSRHRVELDLVDGGGAPLMFPTAEGEVPLRIATEFEPAAIPGAATLSVPLAIGLGPLPYAADRGYEWRISVDGATSPDWKVAFHVASPPKN